jgi:hypothetical protein
MPLPLQVQQWTYSSKTRTVRAAARAARESGVRIRELQPHEFDEDMRRKLQYEVSGEHFIHSLGVWFFCCVHCEVTATA